MSAATASRAGWIATIAVTWLLLQGDLTAANLIGGLLAGLAVVLAFPLRAHPDRHRVHPWALVRFLATVGWSLVTSSAQVVATSLRPTAGRLRSGIVAVDLPGASPLVTTMVANAITVTPGTITVSTEPIEGGARLYVHVLGLAAVDDFRAEIEELRVRATAAITPIDHPGRHDSSEVTAP